MAAWLAAGPGAVVSHESAFVVLDLTDAIPEAIHITLPRARRNWKAPPGVALHTTLSPLGPTETLERDGVRVSSPVRAILEVTENGAAPEQVAAVIRKAVKRGLVARRDVAERAAARGGRIEQAISEALRKSV